MTNIKSIKYILFLILAGISFLHSYSQDLNDSLYRAVAYNDQKTVFSLLEQGADVNYVKSSGWVEVNLLITAIDKGNFDMVKILIEQKADVNWRDGFNSTALMYAARKGSKDIVVLLLDNGADIRADDGKGNTVLSAAKESKNKDLIKFIEGKLKEK